MISHTTPHTLPSGQNKRSLDEAHGGDGAPPDRPEQRLGSKRLKAHTGEALPGWLRCPRELTQGIAWLVAAPTYLGPDKARAQAIGRALVAIAKVHPQLALQLGVLLRMARWSVELTRLWASQGPRPQSDIHGLLSDPGSPPPHEPHDRLLIEQPEQHTRRLEALLKAARSGGPSQDKNTLLKALFLAHLAQLAQTDDQAQAGPPGAHLPLARLPQQLIARDPAFHTYLLMHGELQAPKLTGRHPPLFALVNCLHRLEPDLRFLLMLSFSLAFGAWDRPLAVSIVQRARATLPEADQLLERIEHWRQSFLNQEGEVDPGLAREVLDTLLRAPLMGMEASMRLLLKFCTHAPLRAFATDEVLAGLIHRAMAELQVGPGMLDILRVEYLCHEFPEELGLMGFARLSAEQRLSFVEASCGLAINPYMRAVVQAGDIPPEESAPVLQAMIERLEDDDAQHPALPELRELRDTMARGGAPV